MEIDYERTYHRFESDHWWFVARRQIVRDLVVQQTQGRDGQILELGCSGGQLMQELRGLGYTRITGIDISADAVSLCRNAGLDARLMDAQTLAFDDESFDVLTASDVLEHLQDERRALQEWRRVLKPGGLLIIFVPAFMFLWTEHDEANKHYRRYTARQLVGSLQANGFRVERSSYWNVTLFPPVAAIRLGRRLMPKPARSSGQGDLHPAPKAVNVLLVRLLKFENSLLRMGMNSPFGISTFAVARKP